MGAATIVFLGVMLAAIGYWLVQRYLRSDDFRKMLSAKVSETIGVKGEFNPFQWDGFSVRSPGFQASGYGPLSRLQLTSLQTEIGLGGLRRGVWQVSGTRLQQIELEMNGELGGPLVPHADKVSNALPPRIPNHRPPSWLPDQVELDGVVVDSLSARIHTHSGTASANQLRIQAIPEGTSGRNWDVSVHGGTLTPPPGWLPAIRLGSAALRYNGNTVYLTEFSASAWENAHIATTGELNPQSGEISLEGQVESVKCSEWLHESWAKRLSGEASTDFQFRQTSGFAEASGTLEIRNAVLTALPILDSLAAYADTRRFRTLVLHDASTHWRWKPGELHLSNLQVGCEGLVRLEGSVSIVAGKLNGKLRLGLIPGTLAHIPGAETQVFHPGERNLLWAPINLSGTVDDPREDLTERLMVAAGARMLETLPETGQKVLKFTGKIMDEATPAALEKGRELLKTGDQLIQQGAAAGGIVTDVLENVLSPIAEPPPPRQKPEQEPHRPNP